MHTVTHTFAKLKISQEAYDEIRGLLEKAGYQNQFETQTDGQEFIKMQGIALQGDSDPETPEYMEGWPVSAGFAPRVPGMLCAASARHDDGRKSVEISWRHAVGD